MSSSTHNPAPQWETLTLPQTVVRLRRPAPETPATAIFVLLHGWTGDENFMMAFTPLLPPAAWVVAFRAPYPAHSPRGGYSWVDYHPDDRPPEFDQYQPAIVLLGQWLQALRARHPRAPWGNQHWMGFSQGASTLGAFALQRPAGIASVALLAGFLPKGAEAWVARRPLLGKRAFIAHGTEDTIVPLRQARRARALLTQAGADVTYCEDAVAHKVGARCRKALEGFYAQG